MRNAVALALFAGLLAYLVWVPMPFGSASDASQPALIFPPLLKLAFGTTVKFSHHRMMSLLISEPSPFGSPG